jgi:hypothetical protein
VIAAVVALLYAVSSVAPVPLAEDGQPLLAVESAPPATEAPALIVAGVSGALGLSSMLVATFASQQYFGVCLDDARAPRESIAACNASTPLFAASGALGGAAFVGGAVSLSLLAVEE